MPVFQSPEQLQEVIGGFFKELTEKDTIAQKLLDSKIVIRFNYSDPDLSVIADCTGDKVALAFNDKNATVEVDMWMKADVAHEFWHGKLNLMMALTRKQMTAKGPIPKIMKLLPAIQPAYAMYPMYLERIGHSNLIMR